MVSQPKNYAFSFVRCVATITVVAGHFLQYYGSILAFIFNFCVHMFLFLSGYLYSLKQIDHIYSFYKKCAARVLIPYYIYIWIFIGISFLTHKVQMDTQIVFHLLILKQFTPEVGQFWFLPYILLCYGITPMLHSVLDSCERYDGIRYLLSLFLLLLFVEITVRNFADYFAPVWIESYILGMVMCRCKYRKRNLWKYLKTGLVMMAIIAVSLNISGMLFFKELPHPIFYELFYYFQALAGIGSVLILCWIFDRCRKVPAVGKVFLDWSDKYSFNIYIVHNLFIQGNYSILNVIKNPILGVILICSLILISSVLLHKATEYIQGKCLFVKIGT